MTDSISLGFSDSKNMMEEIPKDFSQSEKIVEESSSKEFSVLELITFSKTVSKDCLNVIKSHDKTMLQKSWAICKLVNNFMNREAFFFFDLVIVLVFSIYNILSIGHIMKGMAFYVLGNLVINCVLFWYFCYCRSLNGKDVITLRRSIQLLSHIFQWSTMGLLVLCQQEHNTIVDDDDSHGRHEYTCTSMFITVNYAKLLWHTFILFKTVVDELASGFVISRGVSVDFITILTTPIVMSFSMLSNFSAGDLKSYLVDKFHITYDVNDITTTTPFYNKLTDSDHDKKLEPAVLFLIYLTLESITIVSDLMDRFYDCLNFTTNQYEPSRYYQEAYILLFVAYTLMAIGGSMTAEHFLCGKNKFCSLCVFILLNFCYRLTLLILSNVKDTCPYETNQYEYCYYTPCSSPETCNAVPNQRFYNCGSDDGDSDCCVATVCSYETYGDTYNYLGNKYFFEIGGVIISGMIMCIFLWQNRKNLHWKLSKFIVEYIAFVLYATVFCPMRPILQFMTGRKLEFVNDSKMSSADNDIKSNVVNDTIDGDCRVVKQSVFVVSPIQRMDLDENATL